jgi:hypothetical protein
MVCLPIAAAVAAALLGVSTGTLWWRTSAWLALALVGQAGTLQWIDAGARIHYQHYRPLSQIVQDHPATAAFFVVQALLAAHGCWLRREGIRSCLRRLMPGWRLAGATAIVFGAGAAVSREIPFFAFEAILAAAVQGVHLATIILAACSLPPGAVGTLNRLLDRWLGPASDQAEPGGLDRFAVSAAIGVTLAAAALSHFVYERHPHIADEVSYLYQARYFATGRVAMDAPPTPAAFNVDLMTYERDRWYSPFPPGWPAALAVGVIVGAPWLVNPVLAGIGILLAYLFFRELLSRRDARLSVLLLCCSPWHVFMAMSFMSHTFTHACGIAAALGVARSRRTGSALWPLASGIATGVVGLIRPLDGGLLGACVGLWAIGAGGKRLRIPALAALGVGVAATGAMSLPYNRALTGKASLAPVMDYFNRYYGPGVNDLGFGPNRGVGWALDPYPGHSPLESLINANLNAFSINVELFGWGCGSLALAALLVFSRRPRTVDCLMLAVIFLTASGLSFYWFSGGPDFGARYWYLMLAPLVVLTVRGAGRVDQELDQQGARATATVLCLCAAALCVYFPWRAADKYHRYLRMRPDVRELAEQRHFGKSLVFIRGARHPDYASAAIYNPLDLRSGATVYAWDRNAEVRSQALRVYPDRPVWVIEGPSLTNAGYRIVAGPLPPGTLR